MNSHRRQAVERGTGGTPVRDRGSVIIADDHGLFRQGLRQLLETEGYTVEAEATTGDEALTAVAEHQGCVLLLDIAMPGMNGLEVAQRLAERGDDVKVVMLSAREDRDALFSAISAGARGYVAKDAEPDQLFAAIDLVLRGGTVLSTGVAQNLGEGIRQLDYAPGAYEQRRLALTDRELEILRLLATPKSPAQIASQLFLSKKTVQNHISAIYRKLGVRSRSEAIVKGMELHLIDNMG
jgi:DNA-binding NarL/FixJ family response regulator